MAIRTIQSAALRVLAIDCGTHTGWATNCAGGTDSGRQAFTRRRGASLGMQMVEFRLWLTQQVEALRPEVVVYEQPGQLRSGAATEVIVGMTTRVQEVCTLLAVDYRPCPLATLKKWATGSGNAKKPAMQAAASQLFPHYDAAADGETADEADALLLLAWSQAGFPEPARPERKRKAVR